MQLYAAAGVVDKGADIHDYPRARIDAISGAVFACIISITIIIATAAAIGGRGPLTSAKEAAEALRPVAARGPTAVRVRPDRRLRAGRRGGAALQRVRDQRGGRGGALDLPPLHRGPAVLGLFTVQVIIGAALALTSINLITLLIGTQVLQGIVTPVILAYILILTNRRSLLGRAANGPLFRVAATVCTVAISAMSLLLLGSTILGFFGIG